MKRQYLYDVMRHAENQDLADRKKAKSDADVFADFAHTGRDKSGRVRFASDNPKVVSHRDQAHFFRTFEKLKP
ncbi:hypothetical protein [Mesorhizobium sp. B4-1-4]|uniref:hypothetical protein n=1 Tax=Mesorhizobium sp. B4-1-4 TaxID=2589888 RepID=UPI001129AAE6|nr:hypothetical protein [Mesorhizobium sp. B4-1-4]UCI32543.1 hypothetical protein FJW03_03550 [Mesorhizobium sp. B4-1-4]